MHVLNDSSFVALLLSAAWKSAAAFVVGALAVFLLRRRSSAARHLAWTASAGVALLLPIATLALPAWRVLPSWDAAPQPTRLAAIDAPRSSTPMPIDAGPRVRMSPTATTTAIQLPPLGATFVAIWAAGAIGCLVGLTRSQLALRSLARECRLSDDPTLTRAVADLRDAFGIAAPVRLLMRDATTMPMTWGIARPVVLLPADASAWSSERRRAVLLHELAHVRRRDCLTHTIALLARAVHWFNPLAWYAVARMGAERERACDEAVLQAGVRASTYANELLSIGTLTGRGSNSLAMPMARRRDDLAQRIGAVLDGSSRRGPLGRRQVYAAAIATLALAIPAAVVATAQPAAQSTGKPGAIAATQPAEPLWGNSREIDDVGRQLRILGMVAHERLAIQHFDRLPHRLGSLFPAATAASVSANASARAVAERFLLPADRVKAPVPADPTPEWIDAHSSIVYLAADLDPRAWDAASAGTVVLLHTPVDAPFKHEPLGDVVIVAFIDGHCEIVPVPKLAATLAASKQAADKASQPDVKSTDAPATRAVASQPTHQYAADGVDQYGWTREGNDLWHRQSKLATAAFTDASDHGDRFAAHLGDLLPLTMRFERLSATEAAKLFLTDQDLARVTLPEAPNAAWINEHASFTFLAAGTSLRAVPEASWGTTVLMHTSLDAPIHHPRGGDQVLVTFFDGHGEMVPFAQVPALIEASKKTIAGAGPR